MRYKRKKVRIKRKKMDKEYRNKKNCERQTTEKKKKKRKKEKHGDEKEKKNSGK